jgi:hypothetical protein
VGGIVRVRLTQGIDESRRSALAMERQLIERINRKGDRIQADRDPDLALLSLVERYRTRYCSPEFGQTLDELDEFCADLLLMATDEPDLTSLYDLLRTLREACRTGDLAAILTRCAPYRNRPLPWMPGEVLGALPKVAGALVQEAARFLPDESEIGGDRALAIETMDRVIKSQRLLVQAAEASHRKSQQRYWPEMQFLGLLLSQLEDASHAALVSATDRPVFRITLLREGRGGAIPVVGDTVNLAFRIAVSGEAESIQQLRILPRPESSHVLYEGEGPRKIDLSSGQTVVQFPFGVSQPEKAPHGRDLTIDFDCTYSRLGTEVTTSMAVVLPRLVPARRVANPFKPGRDGVELPGGSELFTGRQGLLRGISEELLDFGKAPAYHLIQGFARAGKSSVLRQFAENETWLRGKYMSLTISAQLSQDLGDFFEALYHQLLGLLHAADLPAERRSGPPASAGSPPWMPIIELLRVNADIMQKSGKRILLLIDECQCLARWDVPRDNRTVSKEASFQIPGLLNALRDEFGGMVVVLLFGYQSSAESGDGNGAWVEQLGGPDGIATHSVGPFSPEEASLLLTTNLSRHGIRIGKGELQRAYTYSAGHPFLHMQMGHYMFEQMWKGTTLREMPVVRRADVDAAAQLIPLESLAFFYREPWIRGCGDGFATVVLLSATGELSGQAARNGDDLSCMPTITLGDVQKYLHERYGRPALEFRFEGALRDLREHHVLSSGDDQEPFRLTCPVFALAATAEGLLGAVLRREADYKRS